MSSKWSQGDAITIGGGGGDNRDFDDAEKGLYDHTHVMPVLPTLARVDRKPPMHIDTFPYPMSPIHEGLTPFSSVPALSLSWPQGFQTVHAPAPDPAVKKSAAPKAKPSRWILFNLWFNTYRKFFTFVTLLNLTGIILNAVGRFPYAEEHLGALVLGNLLCAILMRNELFLRFLYTIAIYGLRGVRPYSPLLPEILALMEILAGNNFSFAARRGHSFGMRNLRRWVRRP
jgi:hypothetical protein